jgi:ribosomal protein L11 methyltransferase
MVLLLSISISLRNVVARLGRILWSAAGQKRVFVPTAATGILYWLGELGLTANTFAVAWLIYSAPIVIWLIAGLLKEVIRAMQENARKNGVADWLFVTQEVAKISGEVDIVIANILAEPLVKNTREISDRVILGGTLAISDILAERAESVIHAYRERIDFELPATDQTWFRLASKRI